MKTGRAYFGTVPAKSRVIRICDASSKDTGHDRTQLDPEIVVKKLNQRMNGWANYFCLGPVSKAYRAIEKHAERRLRQWLCAKHEVAYPATKKFPSGSLNTKFGLIRLSERTRNFSWAKS
jgi:RNA-directed DNA polymerase